MNRTILCLLAVIAYAVAAPIEGQQGGANAPLNAEAQEIVNSFKPLSDANNSNDKFCSNGKMFRITSAQGQRSKAVVDSLKNITQTGLACLVKEGHALGKRVQKKQITEKASEQAILDACPQNQAEIKAAVVAWKAKNPGFMVMLLSCGDFSELKNNAVSF